MSKKSKSESKERRKRDKRQRKAAQQAKYEAFKERGVNTKSKRQTNKSKRTGVRSERHKSGPCGNAGCKKCLQYNLTKYYRKLQRAVHED